jgi:hypothetical protein
MALMPTDEQLQQEENRRRKAEQELEQRRQNFFVLADQKAAIRTREAEILWDVLFRPLEERIEKLEARINTLHQGGMVGAHR